MKFMKFHLKRVVGSQILTYEEMQTVTCQVEACLNSRPIIAKTSHNMDGIFTLTSGHFLLLKSPMAYPEDPRMPEEPHLLKKWNMCQAMVQHFWDRWSKEYLNTLQARSKWKTSQPNLQEGDIVILKEDKTFSCYWPLAKVLQTYPGKDGLVRVAQIRTSSSTLKRPVTKLALLHREEDNQHPQDPPPSGLPPGVCPGKTPGHRPPDEPLQPLYCCWTANPLRAHSHQSNPIKWALCLNLHLFTALRFTSDITSFRLSHSQHHIRTYPMLFLFFHRAIPALHSNSTHRFLLTIYTTPLCFVALCSPLILSVQVFPQLEGSSSLFNNYSHLFLILILYSLLIVCLV